MAEYRPSIAELKRGDSQAWRWFVDEYGPSVGGYARRFGHPDPEEVTGATLETIARRIAKFEGGHRELRSFVFSVAHSRIVDDVRKRARREVVSVDWEREPSAVMTDAAVESTNPDLLSAIDSMPEELKHMLHLRYVQGLSTRETAKAIGKSEVATRVALSRGISKLRAAMGEQVARDEVGS